MALYLEITQDIAARVMSGELEPGAELPSIRELAKQQHTTASTVSRAYRHLEHAATGMVELATRHRDAGGLLERALNQAARELLLAQSSDWALEAISLDVLNARCEQFDGQLEMGEPVPHLTRAPPRDIHRRQGKRLGRVPRVSTPFGSRQLGHTPE